MLAVSGCGIELRSASLDQLAHCHVLAGQVLGLAERLPPLPHVARIGHDSAMAWALVHEVVLLVLGGDQHALVPGADLGERLCDLLAPR